MEAARVLLSVIREVINVHGQRALKAPLINLGRTQHGCFWLSVYVLLYLQIWSRLLLWNLCLFTHFNNLYPLIRICNHYEMKPLQYILVSQSGFDSTLRYIYFLQLQLHYVNFKIEKSWEMIVYRCYNTRDYLTLAGFRFQFWRFVIFPFALHHVMWLKNQIHFAKCCFMR